MSQDDEYLLDDDGEPYRYANGQLVKLADFDQEPSEKARLAVKAIPIVRMWQERLDHGRWVPPEVIEKYKLKVPE